MPPSTCNSLQIIASHTHWTTTVLCLPVYTFRKVKVSGLYLDMGFDFKGCAVNWRRKVKRQNHSVRNLFPRAPTKNQIKLNRRAARLHRISKHFRRKERTSEPRGKGGGENSKGASCLKTFTCAAVQPRKHVFVSSPGRVVRKGMV